MPFSVASVLSCESWASVLWIARFFSCAEIRLKTASPQIHNSSTGSVIYSEEMAKQDAQKLSVTKGGCFLQPSSGIASNVAVAVGEGHGILTSASDSMAFTFLTAVISAKRLPIVASA